MNKDNVKNAPAGNYFSILTIFEALQEQIAKNIEINKIIFDKCSDMNKILIEMSENQKETHSADETKVQFQEQIQTMRNKGIDVVYFKRKKTQSRILKGVIFLQFLIFSKTKKR